MITLRTIRFALTAASGTGSTSLVLPRNSRLVGVQMTGTLTSDGGAAGSAVGYLSTAEGVNTSGDIDVIRFCVVALQVGAAGQADSKIIFMPLYHFPASNLLYLAAECLGAGNLSQFYAQVYVDS